MTYPGGKNGAGVYQRIICQMPPHATYIEGFLGGGAIMRLKRPATCSIGIDADRDVLLQAQPWAGLIPNLLLQHADAIRWLASHPLTPDTLVYLDPPYLLSTRRSKSLIYHYELSDDDHARLLTLITKLPCMVAISGYWSQMYADALANWRPISFTTTTRGNVTATEWLWMNYPEPLELHDYRYLGSGYRERERIKRKKARWTARLKAMPTLERHALMAAIDELRALGSATPEPTIPTSPTPAAAMPPEDIAPPQQTMLDQGAPPQMALLDQGASSETAAPDPTDRTGDGRSPTTPEPTMDK